MASIPSLDQIVGRLEAGAHQLADAEQADGAVALAHLFGFEATPGLGRVDVAGAPPWGSGSTEGPGGASAVRSIGSISSAADGAKTVMPGMDSASAMSRMP